MSALLIAALDYARREVPVFPVRGKLPLTEHGFKDATTDSVRIQEWWANWPDANVAIPTGSVTGRFVLDVDPRHGGNESLAALEAKHGPLPATLESRTGGTGRHLIFMLPDGVEIRSSAGKLGPGLDIRAGGGYIVVPPSIHPDTKKTYVWVNKVNSAQAPAWLIQMLSNPVAIETNQRVPDAAIPAGQRNDSLVRIAGAMRRKGCTPETIEAALLAENAQRCNPPLPESEVCSIAQSVSRYAPQGKPSPPQTPAGFVLTPLADLLARPDLPVDYVVDNLLVAGTASCVVAKPKVGKSTFARNLCLAVSRGEDFLGLKTKQGECIYLALEERDEDVKNDFRAMGADGSEPIYVHASAVPTDGILALCDLVRQRRPALVVVDPLFRVIRVRDERGYAEMYAAFGVLIDVAREVGTHLAVVHHAGKSEKSDAIDSPLGTTAIAGAVCTIILLKRNENMRTIVTRSRIAKETAESVLKFDPETRTLSLGAEKSAVEIETLSEAILDYLRGADGAKVEPEIDDAVEGKTGRKRQALRQLVKEGKVNREGTGTRGDAFKYRFSFSCSPYMPGTREQETKKGPETRINTGDILVPSSSPDAFLVPAFQAPEKQFDEGVL